MISRKGSGWWLLAGGVLVHSGTGCGRVEGPGPITDPAQTAAPMFEDLAAESGLSFFHYPGATGEYVFVEPVGAGAALLDYDGDGDLDIYLIQSGAIPGSAGGQPLLGPDQP
ncbi:MAG: hypothetical protein WBN31_08380, partial [Gammaproteobacteria bacterium]